MVFSAPVHPITVRLLMESHYADGFSEITARHMAEHHDIGSSSGFHAMFFNWPLSTFLGVASFVGGVTPGRDPWRWWVCGLAAALLETGVYWTLRTGATPS